jgi:hypothetical protein
MWESGRFARRELFPPERRIVVQFRFTDARQGERAWWLVVENGEVDLCRDDPGHEVTLIVESTVRALTEVWTGDLLPEQAMKRGEGSCTGRGARCPQRLALDRAQACSHRRGAKRSLIPGLPGQSLQSPS